MSEVQVLCLGELMLDMVARSDESGYIAGFDMKPGGAAGNVAVACARLGGKAGILAKVSDDFFGSTLKRTMEDNGVDTSGLLMDSKRKIAMAFVTFDEMRKPDYLFYRENSASASMSKADVCSLRYEGVRVLYFSSLGLVKQPLRAANYEAVERARAAGARIAFDPNIRFGVWPSKNAAKREILNMLHFVDICKMNDEELFFLFGEGELEAKCSEVLRAYPNLELIAITLGDAGAMLINHSGLAATLRPLDNDVVDTVGAGDSFFAMLIMRAIAMGFVFDTQEKMRETLEYANTAALITAKRHGAIPAMPRLDEVEELRLSYRSEDALGGQGGKR